MMIIKSRKCHRDVSATAGLLVFVCNTALAGSYQLVYGSGIPLCEAYEQNLAPHHEDMPMACERKYNPTVRGFKSPRWKELNPNKIFLLFQEIEAYQENYGDSPMESTGRLSDIPKRDLKGESYILDHKLKIYESRLDLLHDGTYLNILATIEDSCGPEQMHGMRTMRLFILNKNRTHIDYQSARKWPGLYINTTVEIYDGLPYLENYASDDNWGHLLTSDGTLLVFRPVSSGGFETICKIHWNK